MDGVKKAITDLPEELVELVARRLDRDDLCNLRLASRSLALGSFRTLLEFDRWGELHLWFSYRPSLERNIWLASQPWLMVEIGSVFIHIDNFDHDTLNSAELLHLPKGDNVDHPVSAVGRKRKALYENWLADQEAIIEEGLHLKALMMVLDAMPNSADGGHSLHIVDRNDNSGVVPTYLSFLSLKDEYEGAPPHITTSAQVSAIQTIFEAVRRTNFMPTGLSCWGDWDGMQYYLFSPATGLWSIMDNLRNLTELDLRTMRADIGTVSQEDMRMMVDFIVKLAPNLTHVSLCGGLNYSSIDDLRDDCFNMIMERVRFPKLHNIFISGMMLDLNKLNRWLHRHRKTMNDFHIMRAYTRQRPRHLDDHQWYDALHALFTASGLPLKDSYWNIG